MKQEPEDPDTKTHWAERRTDWAEDRTVMANERTFAGWVRTALASVAVALGLHAVFREVQPTWAAKAVATVFVAASVIIVWSAWHRASRTNRRMKEHDVDTQTSRRMTALTVLLTIGSVATGAILWLL